MIEKGALHGHDGGGGQETIARRRARSYIIYKLDNPNLGFPRFRVPITEPELQRWAQSACLVEQRIADIPTCREGRPSSFRRRVMGGSNGSKSPAEGDWENVDANVVHGDGKKELAS